MCWSYLLVLITEFGLIVIIYGHVPGRVFVRAWETCYGVVVESNQRLDIRRETVLSFAKSVGRAASAFARGFVSARIPRETSF